MEKQSKKSLIRARVKRSQIIVKHAQKHREAHEHAQEEQQALLEEQLHASREAAEREASSGEETWSARTQMVRNRITQRKRRSGDMWNRFAGTAGAGGMGR